MKSEYEVACLFAHQGFMHNFIFSRYNIIQCFQVEILGDKVDELKIILEKVTTLLDCISKSSVTEHEVRLSTSSKLITSLYKAQRRLF